MRPTEQASAILVRYRRKGLRDDRLDGALRRHANILRACDHRVAEALDALRITRDDLPRRDKKV